MIDPNMRNFHGRLNRIEHIHSSGGGFEANGTLGMSYYNGLKSGRRRRTVLRPIALVVMAVMVIKGGVLASIGDETYAQRIEALRTGGTADKLGAYVLQADPMTQVLADMFRSVGA